MQINQLADAVGKEVTLKGWVANKRGNKQLIFIVLRDGSGFCQCVINKDSIGDSNFEKVNELGLESSLSVIGLVVKDEKQIGGYELQANAVDIFQSASEFPIYKKDHGVDYLQDKRHLWLRTKRQWAILKIRNQIIHSIHGFLQGEGFVQTDAPVFTGNACEGTSDLFETDFYGKPAYLSQSGQLYGEAMAMAMGKIYTFGPTFRAEKSKTRRHLSEFWMIEPEMAFYDIFQNMDVIEANLQHIIKTVLKKCKTELEIIGRDTSKLEACLVDFPRLTYDKAVKILKGEENVNGKNAIETLQNDLEKVTQEIEDSNAEIAEREEKLKQQGIKKGERNFNMNKIAGIKNNLKDLEEDQRNIPQWIESAKNFEHGNDFGGSDETVLTRLFDSPVMVYDWPHAIKAFYLKRNPDDDRFARGVDVLAPEGYGEIVGGGERETDHDLLVEMIKKHELPMSDFEWYLDLRKYGTVPHAGYGIGLERMVTWICKLKHVRESIPFPRMYGRLNP